MLFIKIQSSLKCRYIRPYFCFSWQVLFSVYDVLPKVFTISISFSVIALPHFHWHFDIILICDDSFANVTEILVQLLHVDLETIKMMTRSMSLLILLH